MKSEACSGRSRFGWRRNVCGARVEDIFGLQRMPKRPFMKDLCATHSASQSRDSAQLSRRARGFGCFPRRRVEKCCEGTTFAKERSFLEVDGSAS